MLDLKGYKGFKLLKGDASLEANRISVYCLMHDIELIRTDKPFKLPTVGAWGCSITGDIWNEKLKKQESEKAYIPCGSVEWCEKLLGYHVVPDYYPDWLNIFLQESHLQMRSPARNSVPIVGHSFLSFGISFS